MPFSWSPGFITMLDGDAYHLTGHLARATFGMIGQYSISANAEGSATETNLDIRGVPPINQLDTALGSPYITAKALATGGTLKGGNYTIGITAFSDGSATAYTSVYT